jgi:hypothetical protein
MDLGVRAEDPRVDAADLGVVAEDLSIDAQSVSIGFADHGISSFGAID